MQFKCHQRRALQANLILDKGISSTLAKSCPTLKKTTSRIYKVIDLC
jgi:hypothetical protein